MLTNIMEPLKRLAFHPRTNQEDLPMQESRKLPVLTSVAVFVAALAFGLSPALAQNRGARASVGTGYGAGVPYGSSGSHYGSRGAGGVYGPSSGGGSQSLRDVFHGLDPNPGDQLRIKDAARLDLPQQ